MIKYKQQITQAADFISRHIDRDPQIGIVLGTGLGPLAEEIKNARVIPYKEIPNFPKSTVKFHNGRLVLGDLIGKSVFAMQGRFHYYEGYPMRSITLPVRVMHQLGIRTLILSNAAGGIRQRTPAGTIALIKDHINLMGNNPLIGPYDEFLGERFPDMSQPYSKRLRDIGKDVAAELDIPVIEAVYAAVSGPSYETAAEIRMLQTLGVDAVGMSVVPEVLVARQLGMEVLTVTVITDQALPDKMLPVSHEEVGAVADNVGPDFRRLVKGVLKAL
ncbi:MAG: purine-nucleoside phosphorylase [Actinobacteria bacterium]|nr:purine-nucleoside phosphorylase [Actinomycetota bacterium]